MHFGRVDDFEVFHPPPRLAIERRLRFAFQFGRIHATRADALSGREEYPRNRPRRLRRSGALNRRLRLLHGHSVRLAHGGDRNNPDRHVQVANHAPDDRQLLGVLLAEKGAVRLHDVEKLQHDGGDSAKMAGAKPPAQPLADAVTSTKARCGAGYISVAEGAKPRSTPRCSELPVVDRVRG